METEVPKPRNSTSLGGKAQEDEEMEGGLECKV